PMPSRRVSFPVLSTHSLFPSVPFHAACPDLHSFPTRRSSDLRVTRDRVQRRCSQSLPGAETEAGVVPRTADGVVDDTVRCPWHQDRKSTRLNSSHGSNSYAVFCLKKKKNTKRYDDEARGSKHD